MNLLSSEWPWPFAVIKISLAANGLLFECTLGPLTQIWTYNNLDVTRTLNESYPIPYLEVTLALILMLH